MSDDSSTPDITSLIEQVNQLQTRLGSVENENTTLKTNLNTQTQQYKELVLRSLSPEDRQKTETYLAELDKKSDLEVRAEELGSLAKDIRARELILEYGKYGVTKEQLVSAESTIEMEAKALRAKADFLEKTPPSETKPDNQVNPGNTPSDKGTGSIGGASLPPIEGKGRDAVAAHIGSLVRAKRGG